MVERYDRALGGDAVRFALVFIFCVLLQAGDYNAASCSREDVGAAIATATHGDTVHVPAGDCVWTVQLDITVGLHLRGAGVGVTTIRDNIAKDGSANSRLISVSVNSPNNFRLSDISFVGQATDPNVYNQGHIAIGGTQTAFRLHNFSFNTPQTTIVRTSGAALGLIDSCTVNGNRNILTALPAGWGGSAYGDGSWAEQIYWGSDKAIYVEDCTLTANNDPFVTNFVDAFEGARIVIRHNAFTQGNISSHGTDSGGRRRGVRQMEVYENTFTFPAGMASDFIVWIRGGTGVVFGNTVTAPGGINQLVKLLNCRDGTSCGGPWGPFGTCDGSSPYDQNSNSTGYRCVDQPGAGTSRDLGGLATPTETWVENILDPIYIWNNSHSSVGGSINVALNRDFYVGTARPGYTPYPYPHPLRSAAAHNPKEPTTGFRGQVEVHGRIGAP